MLVKKIIFFVWRLENGSIPKVSPIGMSILVLRGLWSKPYFGNVIIRLLLLFTNKKSISCWESLLKKRVLCPEFYFQTPCLFKTYASYGSRSTNPRFLQTEVLAISRRFAQPCSLCLREIQEGLFNSLHCCRKNMLSWSQRYHHYQQCFKKYKLTVKM